MDGLEATEIKLSALERTARIDSEFYKKSNIVVDNVLKQWESSFVTKYFKVSDGNHMSISDEFRVDGIPYYRGQDIYNLFIEDSVPLKITNKAYHTKQMERSHLQKGDILMSIVGAIIGNSAMVTEDTPATCSCKLSILRAKNRSILPELLLIYIKTKYGQTQIQKFKRGASQTGFLLEDFEQLIIPIFSHAFQKLISKSVERTMCFDNDSKTKYQSAEALLLSHLGLGNYTQNPKGIAVKSLSASFGTTGRLDSEYYQPKYEEVLQAISAHNPKQLGGAIGLVDIKKSIEPGSEFYGNEGIPFVRISNLSKYEISEPDIKIPFNTVDNIQKLYPEKDTILLSKDGSVGIAFKVENKMQCVTSGAILHLKIKDTAVLLPDYLTLVLNSKIVQMQAERDAGGSIIQHWKPSEIEDVVIPVLDKDKQLLIAEKVKESFALRKKSTELLELAKTAVEVAIEQGEDKAIAMLKEV